MKDPAQRFQSALEMRDALLNIPLMGLNEGYAGVETGVTSKNWPVFKFRPASYAGFEETPVSPWQRWPRFVIPLLLGIVALAGLGLLGLLLTSNSGKASPNSLVVLPDLNPSRTADTALTATVTSSPTAAADLPTNTLPTLTSEKG